MKSNVPWSVKGIDPEARVVAKEAARRAGMTLGEWMTSMIRDAGEDGAANGDAGPETGVSTDQLRAVVDSVNRLHERMTSTEENVRKADQTSRQVVGGLNQGLETVFERLKRVEAEKAARATTAAPADQEATRARLETLKALEGALSQLVDQVEQTRQDALYRVEENEKAVAALEGRVDSLDEKLTAGFEEVHSALDVIGTQIDQTERTAKAVMLEAREAAASSDEEFVERTGQKLQSLGNEIKRSGDQIAAVEKLVSSLAAKIDAAEQRSADGLNDLAAEVDVLRSEIVPALTEAAAIRDEGIARAATEADASVAALQKSFEEMKARFEGPAPDVADDPARAATMAVDEASDASMSLDGAAASRAPADSDGPIVPHPDDDEAEFDAVFGTDDPASAGAAGDGGEAPGEADASGVLDPTNLTAAEKIKLASEARKVRLDQERDADLRAMRRDDEGPAEIAGLSIGAADGAEDAPVDGEKRGIPRPVLIGGAAVAALAIVTAGALTLLGGGKAPEAAVEIPVDEGPATTTVLPAATPGEVPIGAVPAPVTTPSAAPRGEVLYERAIGLLQSTAEADQVAAFAAMRDGALAGHPPAKYQLGEMYFNGIGTMPDLAAAERWFNEAALSGNAAAMHRLGTLAIEPDFGGARGSEAIAWFERAANYGVVDSMYNLGYLFDPASPNLPEAERDTAASYFWHAVAARQGDAASREESAIVAQRLSPTAKAQIDREVAAWQRQVAPSNANDGFFVGLKAPAR